MILLGGPTPKSSRHGSGSWRVLLKRDVGLQWICHRPAHPAIIRGHESHSTDKSVKVGSLAMSVRK